MSSTQHALEVLSFYCTYSDTYTENLTLTLRLTCIGMYVSDRLRSPPLLQLLPRNPTCNSQTKLYHNAGGGRATHHFGGTLAHVHYPYFSLQHSPWRVQPTFRTQILVRAIALAGTNRLTAMMSPRRMKDKENEQS